MKTTEAIIWEKDCGCFGLSVSGEDASYILFDCRDGRFCAKYSPTAIIKNSVHDKNSIHGQTDKICSRNIIDALNSFAFWTTEALQDARKLRNLRAALRELQS